MDNVLEVTCAELATLFAHCPGTYRDCLELLPTVRRVLGSACVVRLVGLDTPTGMPPPKVVDTVWVSCRVLHWGVKVFELPKRTTPEGALRILLQESHLHPFATVAQLLVDGDLREGCGELLLDSASTICVRHPPEERGDKSRTPPRLYMKNGYITPLHGRSIPLKLPSGSSGVEILVAVAHKLDTPLEVLLRRCVVRLDGQVVCSERVYRIENLFSLRVTGLLLGAGKENNTPNMDEDAWMSWRLGQGLAAGGSKATGSKAEEPRQTSASGPKPEGRMHEEQDTQAGGQAPKGKGKGKGARGGKGHKGDKAPPAKLTPWEELELHTPFLDGQQQQLPLLVEDDICSGTTGISMVSMGKLASLDLVQSELPLAVLVGGRPELVTKALSDGPTRECLSVRIVIRDPGSDRYFHRLATLVILGGSVEPATREVEIELETTESVELVTAWHGEPPPKGPRSVPEWTKYLHVKLGVQPLEVYATKVEGCVFRVNEAQALSVMARSGEDLLFIRPCLRPNMAEDNFTYMLEKGITIVWLKDLERAHAFDTAKRITGFRGLALSRRGDLGARFANAHLHNAREQLTPTDDRFDHTNYGVTCSKRFGLGGLPVHTTAADVRLAAQQWGWLVVPLSKTRTRAGDAFWTVGADDEPPARVLYLDTGPVTINVVGETKLETGPLPTTGGSLRVTTAKHVVETKAPVQVKVAMSDALEVELSARDSRILLLEQRLGGLEQTLGEQHRDLKGLRGNLEHMGSTAERSIEELGAFATQQKRENEAVRATLTKLEQQGSSVLDQIGKMLDTKNASLLESLKKEYVTKADLAAMELDNTSSQGVEEVGVTSPLRKRASHGKGRGGAGSGQR